MSWLLSTHACKFMLPKRRFSKDEQKMKSRFSIYSSMVRSQNEYSRPWKVLPSKSWFHLCSSFQHLRLGGIKFLRWVVGAKSQFDSMPTLCRNSTSNNRMMIACLRCVELRVHASRVKERACKTFYTCWYTMTSWPCEWDYTSILKAGPCETIPNRRLRLNKRLIVTFFCFVSHNLRSGTILETVFRCLAHAGINMVYVDFRRTFQWREYSIWATNNCMLSKRRFWKP
jgi:hypothetical protein